MAQTQQETSAAGADFDLSQFYQIFFEEALENLDLMEQMLLNLDLLHANDEELNGIFRCAHSIKGGAATFGFADVAELTHQMESLLDRLRRHELQAVPQMVDVLLESADASRSLLARHQAGGQDEAVSTVSLLRRIADLAAGPQPAAFASASAASQAPPAPATMWVAPAPRAVTPALTGQVRQIEIRIGPLERLEQADAIKELFRDIPGLGSIRDLPGAPAQNRWFAVQTASSDEELLDLFAFHVAKEQVQLHDAAAAAVTNCATAADATPARQEPTTTVTAVSAASQAPYEFFSGAPGAPQTQAEPVAPLPAPKAVAEPKVIPEPKAVAEPTMIPEPKAVPEPKAGAQAQTQMQMESTTIRVDVKKVDQLINLVGELVITQAMLAQNSRSLDPGIYQQLLVGLVDLDRNTRDLQESVMSIRMIPMSIVFSRFPRMLRDLANRLCKKVDLVTLGEATELDKGLVEKIIDPLTHLVRNSCDHGIELPADRRVHGKSEQGTITLSAAHQGGSIVIEVRDDGRGLSRSKILRKARERGLEASEQMSDADVWQLIFVPGFSTADEVTDVSGRGVGMDVVKRNIAALNGSVEVESTEGRGMKVSVRLPLTLAIMDGMSVGVGDEVYILPLSSVVESFQVDTGAVSTVAQGSQLVKVRDEYMPVIALEKIFQVPRFDLDKSSCIMVVVEADGIRVALLVDELLGQHQVVVKNLESNYRKVPNVSGATILGDGTVALILDTGGLVRRARH